MTNIFSIFQAIHRTFQQDLYRLRLLTARSYVKAITSNMNPINSNSVDLLKLSAQVNICITKNKHLGE